MDTNGMVPIPDKLRDNFAVIRRQENRRNIMKKTEKTTDLQRWSGKAATGQCGEQSAKDLYNRPAPD